MADKKSYLSQVEGGVVKSDEQVLADAKSAYEEALKQQELEIENQKLQKELFIVVNDNLNKLEPEFKYQLEDKFWDLQKSIHLINFKKEVIGMDARLRQLQKLVDSRKEEFERLKGDD